MLPGADSSRHRRQAGRDLLLHLGLLELGEQLAALGQLAAARCMALCLDGLLGLLGGLQRLVVQALEVLHRLLGRDELRREGLRGLLVLLRLGLVTRGAGLVGEHERLAGRALQLLDLAHLAGQLHLQLALVADDGRRLLGQLLVRALRLLDGLLDLDLGVGVLVELAGRAAP